MWWIVDGPEFCDEFDVHFMHKDHIYGRALVIISHSLSFSDWLCCTKIPNAGHWKAVGVNGVIARSYENTYYFCFSLNDCFQSFTERQKIRSCTYAFGECQNVAASCAINKYNTRVKQQKQQRNMNFKMKAWDDPVVQLHIVFFICRFRCS